MKKMHTLIAMLAALALTSACAVPKTLKPAKKKEPEPTLKLYLLTQDELKAGKQAKVLVKIYHMEKKVVLTPEDLEEVRGQKVHLMLIDPTFTDYQHIHPSPTDTAGLYSFTFTPKKTSAYRGWADVIPRTAKRQEFAMGDLGDRKSGMLDKTVSDHASVNGYKFDVSFDQPLKAHEEITGSVRITSPSGETLSPQSVTFAHIDGFYGDYRTVLHLNPVENSLSFKLTPKKAGFLKLFMLFIKDGKEMVAPFGVTVSAE